MASLYSPQAYNVKTTSIPYGGAEEPECGGSSCGAWIIFIIVLILVIAGLIVWLVLSYRRNPADRKIELAGANVEITSPTSITGTWNQTSSTDDVITLYATIDPPVYNSSGSVINTDQFNAKAPGTQTSVTLSKLQPGIKYYSTLIVTNPHTSHFAVYNQIVYMDSIQPVVNEDFEIGHILQEGRIEIDDEEVYFRQAPAEESTVLFSVNSSGQLQSGDMCLYTDVGTDVTEAGLKAGLCSGDFLSTEITIQNSAWTYNHNGFANRWCLTSTLSDTNPRCMVLQPINQTNKVGSIKVSNKSGPGDGWTNIKAST